MIVLAIIIIVSIIVLWIFGIVSLGYFAYEDMKSGDYVFSILSTTLMLLLIAVPLYVGLEIYKDSKVRSGVIIEKGHQETSCSTVYTTINNVTVPNTTCVSAYDYIVIKDGENESMVKVYDKEDFKIGDFYRKHE